MRLVEVPVAAVDARWIATFEDRYGEGSYGTLLGLLRKPCITFAEVASTFGVTRERVRQWHQRLLPGAPTGHERQRLCRLYQQKRRLLSDGLLAGVYRRLRAEIPAQRVRLIASRGGFRTRLLEVDGRLVALKRARVVGTLHTAPVSDATTYVLGSTVDRVDFVYYELSPADYLLLPRRLAPRSRTTFRDTPRSKYREYKNTCAALVPDDRGQVAS